MASIILPSFVVHSSDDKEDKDGSKAKSIFGLDVSPDGSRLATAGLDQKVKIWATESILDPAVEQLPGAHRLLSTLSRHTGAVLAVRFSPSGRYLASSSDDTVCLVWEFDPSGLVGGSFGSSEQNVESWKVRARLTGHESDVVDLAWSADEEDSFLATVGLDASVNVWSGPDKHNPRAGFERVRRIAGHNGFVKGVVWDPKGRFLATQSDDKTMKIWRTSDWTCAKVISEPFQLSPSSNFTCRPSWSPDGANIMAANAMSGPVFVASIIERGSWNTELKLVGHEDSVVVTAFSPRLFKSPEGNAPATVLALGSRDQSISIWMTGVDHPILVLKDVFERQVTDLSWAQDGLTLYASSTAGTVAVIQFTAKQLAEPLSLSESSRVQPKPLNMMHSTSSSANGSQMGGTMQRPNMLQPRSKHTLPPARASSVAPPRAASIASNGLPQPASARAGAERLPQQIQIMSNGKRRIKPTLIGGDTSSDSSYEFSNSVAAAAAPAQSSAPSQFARPLANHMDVDTPSTQVQSSQFTGQQRRTSGFGGDSIASSSLPQSQPQYQQQAPIIIQQTQSGPPDFTHLMPSTTWREEQAFEAGLAAARLAKGRSREGKTVGGDLTREPVASSQAMTIRAAEEGDFFSKGIPKALATPAVMSVLRRDGEGGGAVEVKNYDGTRPVEVSVLEGTSDSAKLVWMDFVSSFVLRVALSLGYLALALQNGSILVYTNKGRRVTTIALDSPVCLMECRGAVLMVITSAGNLHRWNLQQDKELHRPISCLSLLSGPDEVQATYLHSNGLPVLILRSEQAWTIDGKKNAWTLIASGWFADCSPVWESRGRGRHSTIGGSQLPSGSAASTSGSSNINAGVPGSGFSTVEPAGRWRDPIRGIESEINSLVVARSETGVKPAVKPPTDDALRTRDFELSATLRHYELRMQGAVLLDSKEEFLTTLRAYAKKISDEGLKMLGEELIRDFLGPIYYQPNKDERSTWDPTIFDLPKRTVCKELLAIMGKGRFLGGMVSAYQELLKSMMI